MILYRHFFLIPKTNYFDESIVRFDRVQTITGKNPSTIEPTKYCLKNDFFNILLSMFIFCISGEIDKDMEEIRDLIRSTYPEKSSCIFREDFKFDYTSVLKRICYILIISSKEQTTDPFWF